MGLRKAWVYDNTLPAALMEELNANGYEVTSPCGRRLSLEEKQEALEMHSLSASGDLLSENAHDWARASVAARAHELKMRMKKVHNKNRRPSSLGSDCIGEDVRRYMLDNCDAWPEVERTGERGKRDEFDKKAKPNLYHDPRVPLRHQQATSEAVVINTVDDLVKYLERIGRLQPSSSSALRPLTSSDTTGSPTSSVCGSIRNTKSGDSSRSSLESGASEDGYIIDAPTAEKETLVLSSELSKQSPKEALHSPGSS